MVNPFLNRLAGRPTDGSLSSSIDQQNSEPLVITVRPPDAASFDVDLRCFRDGAFLTGLTAQAAANWTGDFRGRSRLIEELEPVLSERYGQASRATWKSTLHSLRCFWRYLDVDSDFLPIEDLAHVTDAHGVRFRRYVFDNGKGILVYKQMRTILQAARHYYGQRPLFWDGLSHPAPKDKNTPSPEAVRALYSALKQEARSIKRMFAEGEALAAAGLDPRGEVSEPGSAAWETRANHAWLVRALTRQFIPDKRVFTETQALGLHKPNTPDQYHKGPTYLAPGQEERAREGIVGKLRWFFPALHDTAVFFLLFQIGTGWNMSTVCNLDVSDLEAWVEDHPIRKDLKILRSWKARAGRDQIAISLARPEFHPYGILHFMIERTQVLRATLYTEIDRIEAEMAECASSARLKVLERSRDQMTVKARSPWLFLATNKIGEISAIDVTTPHVNAVLRATIARHDLGRFADELADLTNRQFRDAWIGYAYEKSGYQWLIAQIAAGHTGPETLRRYLAQRRWRLHDERQIRVLQDAIMAEIRDRRLVDGAALRMLVQTKEITEEQRQRLDDYRMRSRLGVGCRDPRHPPTAVAPGHRGEHLCAVQRCTICRHAIVFPDSLEGIARRKAELIVIQETMPMASWLTSSYPEELEATEFTLRLFPAGDAEMATARNLDEIRSTGLLFDADGVTGGAQ